VPVASDTTGDRRPADPDPQALLPEPLRGEWAVLPRRSAYWIFASGALLGLGLGGTAAGLAVGPRWLKAAFPVAMLLAFAGARLLRRHEERLLRDLGPHLPR
jgi:hypothetical protein